jgi:hypothetical protein
MNLEILSTNNLVHLIDHIPRSRCNLLAILLKSKRSNLGLDLGKTPAQRITTDNNRME